MFFKIVTRIVLLKLDFVVLPVFEENLEVSFYLIWEVIMHVFSRFFEIFVLQVGLV